MTMHQNGLSALRGPRAGVCLHITSLPGRYGIGEIGQAARDFIDTLRTMNLGVWQFLPLGPTAYGDSPYQPLSTFAGNELLIDIEELVGTGLLEPGEVAPLENLPDGSVDYGRLIPLKSSLLETAAARFPERATPALREAFATFVDRHDANWLHDYALFRRLKRRHDERPWPTWAPQFRRRDAAALADFAASDAAGLEAIKVLQFLFREQWQALRRYAAGNGVLLFGDMPIYIALDSADAWARPQLLRIDADGLPDSVAGVPPDYFSEDGQLWGNPLYAWDHHAACGFRWWIERVRATLELVDIVRIDHFRGFEAYWAIPATAATAREGAWEAGPGGAIFEAMHRELGALPIVAENLGVITAEVEALRKTFRMPGMVVLQFTVADPAFRLDAIDVDSVCYTGTHDNDTTTGWFHGGPGDTRSSGEIAAAQAAALALTGGTPHGIHLDLLRLALSTRAKLVIAPMQDLLGLGSEARMNTPGTSANNWRWRLRAAQLTPDLCDNLALMVSESGRCPQ